MGYFEWKMLHQYGSDPQPLWICQWNLSRTQNRWLKKTSFVALLATQGLTLSAMPNDILQWICTIVSTSQPSCCFRMSIVPYASSSANERALFLLITTLHLPTKKKSTEVRFGEVGVQPCFLHDQSNNIISSVWSSYLSTEMGRSDGVMQPHVTSCKRTGSSSYWSPQRICQYSVP
jgi:hypothetical protein